MTDLNRPDSSNLDAYILTTGTQVVANRSINNADFKTLGCTLSSGTTYVFPLGTHKSAVPAESPLITAQVWWNSAITITAITVETCIWPSTPQAHDPRGANAQVTDWDSTSGFWLQQNPSTAYVPITGGTATALTANPTALTQGGCEFDLGNLGPRRVRIKVVVAGTGGVVRVGVHGKAAAA